MRFCFQNFQFFYSVYFHFEYVFSGRIWIVSGALYTLQMHMLFCGSFSSFAFLSFLCVQCSMNMLAKFTLVTEFQNHEDFNHGTRKLLFFSSFLANIYCYLQLCNYISCEEWRKSNDIRLWLENLCICPGLCHRILRRCGLATTINFEYSQLYKAVANFPNGSFICIMDEIMIKTPISIHTTNP